MANKKMQVASVVNDEIMGACVSADVIADEMGNVFVTANMARRGNVFTARYGLDVDGGADVFAALNHEDLRRGFQMIGVRSYNAAAARLASLLSALTVDAIRDEIAAGNTSLANCVRDGWMRTAFAHMVCTW